MEESLGGSSFLFLYKNKVSFAQKTTYYCTLFARLGRKSELLFAYMQIL
jgi:hypothetical protein